MKDVVEVEKFFVVQRCCDSDTMDYTGRESRMSVITFLAVTAAGVIE